jgi:hypothetical protein
VLHIIPEKVIQGLNRSMVHEKIIRVAGKTGHPYFAFFLLSTLQE